ncbi:hypothetical protein J4434_07485 [Candidatus Woesearchaeota archaeon]|nr:hypothetical protein [Candidatus Woesearchaeota archaeon]
MSNNYYNQYGQQIPDREDYNSGPRSSLASLAIEGAVVLGAVLVILQFASKCNIDYFDISGQNKHQGNHLTAPAHSTSPSSINSVIYTKDSAIDTKVEFRLDTSGIDNVVGK